MRVTHERRTPRRMVSILATLGLMAGMLSVLTAAASAAPTKTCRVENTTLGKRYAPSIGASLQLAINDAASGSTLEVRGRCVGVFSISNKTLELIGVATRKFPVASLDGNGANDHVVSVSLGSVVTFTGLRITGAHCLMGCLGGGISNFGTIILNGSTQVTGNFASGGGGIFNDSTGTVVLEDGSTVSGNTADDSGGGLFSRGTVTLYDSSSVSGNTAGTVGGGIVNNATGTVTLNDSSSVRGNTATNDGGGIYNNDGGVTLHGSSSVSGNTAGLRGGGIFNVASPAILNESSSVSGNTAPTCPDTYPCT